MQSSLGLSLGVEAPVVTPTGVVFIFFLSCYAVCLVLPFSHLCNVLQHALAAQLHDLDMTFQ